MDQYFSIKCPRHPKQVCEVFTTQVSPTYCLLCSECFQEEAIQPLSIVKIDDILNENNKRFLKNWPPLGERAKEIFQDLLKLSSSFDSQDIEQAVNKFFDCAQQSLVEAIRKKKKEVLQQISSVASQKKQTIKEYQQLSQIEQLKKALKSNSDSKLIEQDLKSIIENQINNMNTNSEKLQSITNLNQSLITLELDKAQETLNQLIENISHIKPISTNEISRQPLIKEYLLNFHLEIENNLEGHGIITCQSHDSRPLIQTFSQKNIKNKDSYCSLTNLLQSDKKYILKLKFINQDMFISSINLIPKEFNSNDYQIQFRHNGNSSSSRVIKGQQIWNDSYYRSKGQYSQKKEVSIELRICIKDKYIVVLDRPSYSNAIQIGSWDPDKFVSNSDYQLQLYIFGKNDLITVEELMEVDKFPDI